VWLADWTDRKLNFERGVTVGRKSHARLALERALAEASTPQERAEIAWRIVKATESESRTRAREKRQRDKAKAAKPAAKPDDANEPFEVDDAGLS
jgi:hypothetical protein